MLRHFVDAIRTRDGDILMLLQLTLGYELALDTQLVLEHVLLSTQCFDFAVALDVNERESDVPIRTRRGRSYARMTSLVARRYFRS